MPSDSSTGPDGANSFGDLIGLEVTELEAGYSLGELQVTDQLKNPYGVLHGAAAYAMVDTGMGAAVVPGLEADESCATIEIKISYLDAIRDGRLECETNLRHRGGSVAFLESNVTRDGDSVARATGSFAIFEP